MTTYHLPWLGHGRHGLISVIAHLAAGQLSRVVIRPSVLGISPLLHVVAPAVQRDEPPVG